ncbi:MAG TPA: flagellar protein FlaG [Candidatus Latescibacteria bacterium]|nr:flagellar protein FlaG [Candidatus Handelsmanbacteria bacterium]HIL10251.1 flagellar protein FlaG [Candidatus Latescibacterota bacterium]
MNNISSQNTQRTQASESVSLSERSPEATALSDKQSAAPAPASAPIAQREVGVAKTEALVKELNSALEKVDGDYSVSVDNATGMVVVRITDVDTGEIVKQVPPQQMLDISMSVEKIIGLLVNDQG